jgi:hypothetical protein
MIKKSVFEDELIAGMQSNLIGQETHKLSLAVDYLNSAVEILEEAGLTNYADQILDILLKTAIKHQRPADPRKIPDPHTRGLTPEQMIKNLLHHGTEFNMSDDNNTEDLLNAEVDNGDNPEMIEADFQSSFEDEK